MRGVIFCDGACLGNPGAGGWAFVLSDGVTVEEGAGREIETTNNRMELQGAIEALKRVAADPRCKDYDLYCDSKYVVEGIRFWLPKWKRNSWRASTGDAVKNQEYWQQLDAIHTKVRALGVKIHFVRVPGHAGIPGNERCDELAQGFARSESPRLYHGPAKEYDVDLSLVSFQEPIKTKKPYYLSVIEGKVHRDDDWAACEARVRGRKGVKFKKVHSPLEEQNLLKLWGLPSV